MQLKMADRPSPQFHTTRWTQVLAARGSSSDAQQALRELCEAYQRPIEVFIQRYCQGRDDARDLSQEFIAKLLAGNPLVGVDQTRGKFRTYLLGAVKHFLADQRDRELAAKRGGGERPFSLEQQDASLLSLVDPQGFPSDAFFDHAWALAVVEDAMLVLQKETEHSAGVERFAVLKKWLIAAEDSSAMEEAAQTLQITSGALKVAIHRLRKRFRQIVKEKIAATIDDPAEVQAELSYLIAALMSQGET